MGLAHRILMMEEEARVKILTLAMVVPVRDSILQDCVQVESC